MGAFLSAVSAPVDGALSSFDGVTSGAVALSHPTSSNIASESVILFFMNSLLRKFGVVARRTGAIHLARNGRSDGNDLTKYLKRLFVTLQPDRVEMETSLLSPPTQPAVWAQPMR